MGQAIQPLESVRDERFPAAKGLAPPPQKVKGQAYGQVLYIAAPHMDNPPSSRVLSNPGSPRIERKRRTTADVLRGRVNPKNTGRSPTIGMMLCQRRRRWHNIVPTLTGGGLNSCWSEPGNNTTQQTRPLTHAVLMLGQHRRRWPNKILVLDGSLLFAG